jgi:(p)ppGpp synthase/HD superfamily hydrolase
MFLNPNSPAILVKAHQLASQAHHGQMDQGGNPYLLHLEAVANLVNTTEEKVVSLLHDIVEDTPVTLDDLSKLFPEVIVTAVDAMTKREKTEKFIDYLKRAKANPIAKNVKIADMIHNSDLSRLPFPPREQDIQREEKYQVAIAWMQGLSR